MELQGVEVPANFTGVWQPNFMNKLVGKDLSGTWWILYSVGWVPSKDYDYQLRMGTLVPIPGFVSISDADSEGGW